MSTAVVTYKYVVGYQYSSIISYVCPRSPATPRHALHVSGEGGRGLLYHTSYSSSIVRVGCPLSSICTPSVKVPLLSPTLAVGDRRHKEIRKNIIDNHLWFVNHARLCDVLDCRYYGFASAIRVLVLIVHTSNCPRVYCCGIDSAAPVIVALCDRFREGRLVVLACANTDTSTVLCNISCSYAHGRVRLAVVSIVGGSIIAKTRDVECRVKTA